MAGLEINDFSTPKEVRRPHGVVVEFQGAAVYAKR